MLRYLPLALIAVAAIIGALTLRQYLSFEALKANREALIAFRDAHYVVAVFGFIALYTAIVTFSLAGAGATDIVALAAQRRIAMSVSSPMSTRIDAMRRQLPDVVRASPHYFNTTAELDILLDFVGACKGGAFLS